jgi:hypothetical protein
MSHQSPELVIVEILAIITRDKALTLGESLASALK